MAMPDSDVLRVVSDTVLVPISYECLHTATQEDAEEVH